MAGEVYDKSPPHPCERLARLEGQSNFLSLLAGIEAGPDTTEDAAALAMSRQSWLGPPELLEAYWCESTLYRRPICQGVFDLIDGMGRGVAEKDRVWTKAAIFDAFELFGGRVPSSGKARAKQFKARTEDYYAARKLAEGLLYAMTGDIQRRWLAARFRETGPTRD